MDAEAPFSAVIRSSGSIFKHSFKKLSSFLPSFPTYLRSSGCEARNRREFDSFEVLLKALLLTSSEWSNSLHD